jgi:hypothetical protein
MDGDRELMTRAAKAADLAIGGWNASHGGFATREYEMASSGYWNPLADDGDALRLAVRLGLQIVTSGTNVMQATDYRTGAYGDAPIGESRYAATRRAIVSAAASLAEGGSRG